MRKLIGKLFFRIFGWKMYGELPKEDKYVLLCVPHTSNWDFVYFLAGCWAFGTYINWLGKHTLFEGSLGRFLSWTGGVAVDRAAPQGLVEDLAAKFAARDEMHLAIPPSGTRAFREYWKSGFYHIARAANVPIVLGVLDFRTKECGFGPAMELTGDVSADMDRIREFYFGMQGKFPDKQARMRLRSEDGQETSTTTAA